MRAGRPRARAIEVERDGQVLPLTVDVARVDRPQAQEDGPVEIVGTGPGRGRPRCRGLRTRHVRADVARA
ncbi:hypothetical protein DI005_00040 [Prauserella sp. PE36]|nr:hypothetical protein DI005_00040 [Prauserella sp. PE36]